MRCGGSPSGPGSQAPLVAAITPGDGPAKGGTSVHISGSNFAAGATVTIGGAPATDVVVESASTITAKTGAGAAGAADVVVNVGGRTGALPGAFTYLAISGEPPVIAVVTARGTRPNEPAGFADAGEEVSVKATVEDADTPPDRLVFQWSADVGTFSDSGAVVKWRAPADASTPATLTLSVTVSDNTGNVTNGSTTVSLHNSVKEVGDLAREFLIDFSDSNREPAFVVRNFTKSPRCERERDDEFSQIEENRKNYQITGSLVGPAAVKVQFASRPCAYEARDGDACAAVPARWDSVCRPGASSCSPGRSDGTDFVTAVYEQSQWKLCASYFQGRTPLQPGFIR